MGWTMTMILSSTRTLQKEQLEVLEVISMNMRTANDTLTALKSTVATTERSVAILETQARQLDVLLQKMGVKGGKRPWMSGLARHGLTGDCHGSERQQGPEQEASGGPPPQPLRVALGLDGDSTSTSTCESGGRRGGIAGGSGDSSAAGA
ncbi:hypothetical protein NCU07600 [Neurospora crassa OR74A]|uniref:Uncharacterized protein n=1 Tax=Neurospora crassa (strain ATCC 24698 / 74-OR23-1A / CBS 708.71 / DSM 1257 / FGSC 987) TaxID=367110 RepID=Q7SBF6_NEUCR|nr:hypothetical protein NCU07600 [Neurospora crassa OR74A]EAA33744.1 hypothetical protein NCU07600 [Neurospora crassa OR74A]|eukprot:XP_962980.1 hypothetical protein NCU07600 [Neurospora crassa OR74A]